MAGFASGWAAASGWASGSGWGAANETAINTNTTIICWGTIRTTKQNIALYQWIRCKLLQQKFEFKSMMTLTDFIILILGFSFFTFKELVQSSGNDTMELMIIDWIHLIFIVLTLINRTNFMPCTHIHINDT